MPHAALIATREHAGDHAAGWHAGGIAAEVAARTHAREVRHGVTAGLSRAAQSENSRVGAGPGPRRVPDEQRTPPLAVARRRQEARAAEIALRRRRHADEIDALAAVEREQARA